MCYSLYRASSSACRAMLTEVGEGLQHVKAPSLGATRLQQRLQCWFGYLLERFSGGLRFFERMSPHSLCISGCDCAPRQTTGVLLTQRCQLRGELSGHRQRRVVVSNLQATFLLETKQVVGFASSKLRICSSLVSLMFLPRSSFLLLLLGSPFFFGIDACATCL